MPKRVVIVGAGGFGRGVYEWIQQSPAHRKRHDIVKSVFVDDNFNSIQSDDRVVGTVRDYFPGENDEVIVAVGVPQLRREIVDNLANRGVQFHTFVDDRAVLAGNVQPGTGSVICPGTVVSADASIGSHVHINFNCSVGHDTVLGDFSTLSPMSNIMGETNVGVGVFVGGSAVVLPRLEIANEATIGAGATVVHTVTSKDTVVGNPARHMNGTCPATAGKGSA